MANVKILKCQGCGANLSPNNTTCEYCESVNVVESYENPFSLDESLAKKYTNFYKEKIKSDPSDGEAIFSLGLFYLKLKLYDLAVKNFARSIELIPEEADTYYYYSLSLIKGRRIKILTMKEIQNIEEYLNTAIQLEDKQCYYLLLASIKYDFYKQNGFRIPEPSYEELIDLALKQQPISDIDKHTLSENIILRDGPVYNLIY
ncbi:MAG: hypothetical protein K9I95_14455 [Flavobacteriaceae bacterium]|nr:hypothetical protein [Flavobacteriaceae bacterium]MCF8428362.1 hypothetical protein [Bacteroidia bacterium]